MWKPGIIITVVLLFCLLLAQTERKAETPQNQPAKGSSSDKESTSSKTTEGWWRVDYDKARIEAMNGNKILLLLYGGLGDTWTKRLREVFSKEGLGEMADKVVCCFVKEDNFVSVSKFRVRRRDVPTVLFIWSREERVFGRLTRPTHFRKALETLKAALKGQEVMRKLLASAKADDLLKLARFFLSCNEYSEAERALRRTISLAKKDEFKLQARVMMLDVYIGRNEPYRIRTELREIEKIDPEKKRFAPERLFAEAYMEQFVTRDRKKAEQLWRSILRNHSGFARLDEVKLYLGLILYARADIEGAKNLWREVAKGEGEPAHRAKSFLKLADCPGPTSLKESEEREE